MRTGGDSALCGSGSWLSSARNTHDSSSPTFTFSFANGRSNFRDRATPASVPASALSHSTSSLRRTISAARRRPKSSLADAANPTVPFTGQLRSFAGRWITARGGSSGNTAIGYVAGRGFHPLSFTSNRTW